MACRVGFGEMLRTYTKLIRLLMRQTAATTEVGTHTAKDMQLVNCVANFSKLSDRA